MGGGEAFSGFDNGAGSSAGPALIDAVFASCFEPSRVVLFPGVFLRGIFLFWELTAGF